MLRLSNGERFALELLTQRFITRAGQPRRPEDLARLIKAARTTQLSLGEDNGDRTLRLDVARELDEMHLITMTEDGTGAWCYLLPLGLGYGMGLLVAGPKRTAPASAGAEPELGNGSEDRRDEATTDSNRNQEIARLRLELQDTLAAQRLAEMQRDTAITEATATREAIRQMQETAKQALIEEMGRYDQMVLRLTRELNEAWLERLGKLALAAVKSAVAP